MFGLLFFFGFLFFLSNCLHQGLKGAELFILQVFGCLVDHHVDENLDGDLLVFLADEVELPVFVRLDVVDPGNAVLLFLYAQELVDPDRVQLLLDDGQGFGFEGHSDPHVSSRDLELGLQLLDALQSLALGRLVRLYSKVDFLDGLFDGLGCETALGGGVHALLHDDLDDLGGDAGGLGVSLLVGDLELACIRGLVPLERMISMISRLVLLGKNLWRSFFLATVPWEAFSKISSVCSTSSTSCSSPLR